MLTNETTDHIQDIDQSQRDDATSQAPLKLGPCHKVADWGYDSHLQESNCDGEGEPIQCEQCLQKSTWTVSASPAELQGRIRKSTLPHHEQKAALVLRNCPIQEA